MVVAFEQCMPATVLAPLKISRAWNMPNARTFRIKVIKQLLSRYITPDMTVIEPYSRNSGWGTVTNDLDPEIEAQYHMPADKFAAMLLDQRGCGWADGILFDPPFSPRQMICCYRKAGLSINPTLGRLGWYNRRIKHTLVHCLKPGAIVIECGWHSGGFGKRLGMHLEEILLVAHGGCGRNDTIVTVERFVGVDAVRPAKTQGWHNYQRGVAMLPERMR